MTTGTFILSLDCEGYWGMADMITGPPREGWASRVLEEVYGRLARLLDAYEIPATWAFVAAFVHTREEMDACSYLLDEPIPYRGRDWAEFFKTSYRGGDAEGWLCPQALDIVRASGAHEIAAHGFSHLPLAEAHTSDAAVRRELSLLADFWGRRGIHPRTFVFPRNQPGHLALLADQFEAYRPPHPLEVRRDPAARIRRLGAEMDLWAQPAEHGRSGRPAALPPAILLNHRAGGRRLVPAAVTLARVRRMLRRAIETGRVVHLYTHPHNFITGRGQLALLEGVLAQVAEYARAGDLQVLTQAEYARRLRSEGFKAEATHVR
jgi:peptidoglycan/xylan/chitin deacetylase (PgdA/CDA1 family)